MKIAVFAGMFAIVPPALSLTVKAVPVMFLKSTCWPTLRCVASGMVIERLPALGVTSMIFAAKEPVVDRFGHARVRFADSAMALYETCEGSINCPEGVAGKPVMWKRGSR